MKVAVFEVPSLISGQHVYAFLIQYGKLVKINPVPFNVKLGKLYCYLKLCKP